MFILHLILLVVFCIVERFGVMKAPDGILLIPVVSITICVFSCAFPLIWMCISLSSFSLALGVVDLAVMLEFILFFLFFFYLDLLSPITLLKIVFTSLRFSLLNLLSSMWSKMISISQEGLACHTLAPNNILYVLIASVISFFWFIHVLYLYSYLVFVMYIANPFSCTIFYALIRHSHEENQYVEYVLNLYNVFPVY